MAPPSLNCVPSGIMAPPSTQPPPPLPGAANTLTLPGRPAHLQPVNGAPIIPAPSPQRPSLSAPIPTSTITPPAPRPQPPLVCNFCTRKKRSGTGHLASHCPLRIQEEAAPIASSSKWVKPRRPGKLLTQEEVDMVMRVYVRLQAESKLGFVGHRVAERTSMYTGVSAEKIKALVAEARKLKDGEYLKAKTGSLRGKYTRTLAHRRSGQIREIVDERNKLDEPVTINIGHEVNEQAVAGEYGEAVSKEAEADHEIDWVSLEESGEIEVLC
ncbi:hypothetical protein HK104_009339 [Borealophlyctis nickersoniae]|nr:hypothetical protein HK104_009339 [Borealophlyctis nickersoniae]